MIDDKFFWESEQYRMKNDLGERDDYFASVDYSPLLKGISSILKSQTAAFQVKKSGDKDDKLCLQLDLDTIALAVARKSKQDNAPFTNLYGTTYSSVNFADDSVIKDFNKYIDAIKGLLLSHLEQAFKKTLPGSTNSSLTDFVEPLLGNAKDFHHNVAEHLDYPFLEKKTLSKRRLHLRPVKAGGSDDIRLKGHKLTITVKNIREFESELIEGLCNKLEEVCECEPQDINITRETLKRRLNDSSSTLSTLSRVLRKESLGRLHKEAAIRYLEFLRGGMEQKQERNGKQEVGLSYLRILIHRLRLLEDFVNDETKDDAAYQVSYSQCSANYRDLFARADAYETLPIVPEIEGSLGESTNKEKGEQIFIAGLKLKLNGHVQTYDSVLDYYVALLDPDATMHQEQISPLNVRRQFFAEKVLKVALLYYFVFSKPDDEAYDPRQDVERELLAQLRAGDETEEVSTLRRLRDTLSILNKDGKNVSPTTHVLATLKNALEVFVKVAHIGPDAETYALHLVVENGLLDEDPSRMLMEKEFFRTDALQDGGRAALKYISVQDANADESGFCTLPVSMSIEPIYYFSPEKEPISQFDMQYAVNGYQLLPTIFVPADNDSKSLCDTYYKNYSRVVVSYSSKLPFRYDDAEAYVYRFTLLFLSYLCLKLLCDSVSTYIREQHQRLFVPVVRIHKNKRTEKEAQTNEESTISSISKTVSHLLAGEYFSNAQGFHIDVLRGRERYKLTNGLSSLYTALPKKFVLQHPLTLDKLAVIVVSSRKCDANNTSRNYIASIYGEVTGINNRRSTKDERYVETLRTFTDYEDSDKMYRTPIVLRDQVKKCYEEGYRHLLYIAQAPYTSTLHITSTEEDEEQFFMSKEVIQFLTEGLSDLNIYPIYCDKYYVVKTAGSKNPNAESLYVDDLSELRTLFADPNRSSIVFFNLFNGYTLPDVGPVKRTYYNGVLSYATLVNVYDNPIHDQAIRNNLLDGKQTGSLKHDFLDFLTLLHFSRYEKSEKDGRRIYFKLEPYQNIIGSEAVGPLSLLSHHTASNVRFNSLAFLTAVRKSLNKEYVGYKSLSSDDEQGESGESKESK